MRWLLASSKPGISIWSGEFLKGLKEIDVVFCLLLVSFLDHDMFVNLFFSSLLVYTGHSMVVDALYLVLLSIITLA